MNANKSKVLFRANIFQTWGIVLLLVVFALVLKVPTTLYCKWLKQLPELHYIHCAAIAQPQAYAVDFNSYDVFWALPKLSMTLSEILFALSWNKMWIPARELAEGRPEIGLYVENVTKRRKVIILLSGENYNKDRFRHEMKLQHVILPSLYENTEQTFRSIYFIYSV